MKKQSQKPLTQREVLVEYFKQNPKRDIPHAEIVDWATKYWNKQNKTVFRDPDRGIRRLHQEGMLVKVGKGIYRYDPKMVAKRNLEDFTPELKKKILKRDEYKCVICGYGKKEGIELHVDHIKAKDFGGRAIYENGQTLCAQHNFLKKNFKQTETGKRLFIRLYELSKAMGDIKLMKFTEEILTVFEKNKINGHIEWTK